MSKKRRPTYWQDVGNEVFDGLGTVGRRTWKEATMRDDSWNQQACEAFGNAGVACIGAGAIAHRGIGWANDRAADGWDGMTNGVHDWADERRSFADDSWPYN